MGPEEGLSTVGLAVLVLRLVWTAAELLTALLCRLSTAGQRNALSEPAA
jgi:hypothetical protein